MKQKITVGAIIFLFVLTCGFVVWKLQQNGVVVTAPNDHTWSEYKNSELGFAINYPSDILHPRQIAERPSPDGIFPGANTVIFFDGQEQQRHFSIWIQQTKARNADEWFKEVYGSDGKGWHISTTTTIANAEAVGVAENMPSIAYDNYNLNFVHGGNAWSLSFDDAHLSQEDINYISKSFHFLR